MIRSMTGFGEAEETFPEGLLRVEVKSVNHRYLNTSFRLPPGFDRFEAPCQGWVKGAVSRGHVTLSVSWEPAVAPDEEVPLELDLPRARRYRDLLREAGDALGIPGALSLDTLARFRDVFRTTERPGGAPEIPPEALEAVVRAAVASLVEAREREGRSLREDMEARLDAMAAHLETVAERAPARLVRERDRLRASIEALAGDVGVDEDRLAREVAHMADKWDINEEVVRFRSHIQVFRETLDGEAEEAVGKRLSFLAQEMLREANTIGSKANDLEITQASVALKEEIERIREQVENVE